jgi:hypothetical protein
LETVTRFASLDYQGFRIGSEGHQAIWQLTLENGEPRVFPIYVVAAYRVLSPQKPTHPLVWVPVEYDIIGLVEERPEGVIFKPHRWVSKDVFPVRCTREGCKIDIDRELFKVTPRAGKAAVLAWLKKLEGLQDTAPEKRTYSRLFEEITLAK